MGTGSIFTILLLILETVKGVNLNGASLDIGETSAYITTMDLPSFEGCNTIKEAIKVLQLDTIESLREEISVLKAKNALNEGERQLLEKKEVDNLAIIEKMKKDQQEETKQIRQMYEDQIEELEANFLEKETILNNTLSNKDTLLEYVYSVLRDNEQIMQSWQNTIKTQSKELNESNKQMEECQKYKGIVIQSQETIRTQSENIKRLEQVIVINKNLTRSYQNVAKQQEELVKKDCDVALWISTLSDALSSQKTKIDTLTAYLENKNEIEEDLSSLKSQVVNINISVDNNKLMENYEKLLERQSKSLSLLRTTLTKKRCMPIPPADTGLEVTEVHFDCKDRTKSTYDINCSEGQCNTEIWPTCEIVDEETMDLGLGQGNENVTLKHFDCEEVNIPYMNQSVGCGSGGMKISMMKSVVGNGVFDQELSTLPCSDCDEELFQWSSWSIFGNVMTRKRGSSSIVDSYQEQNCPSDWSHYGSSCFKYVSSPQYWSDAQTYCVNEGGNLTSINSSEENDFIITLINTNDRAWIGGTDEGQEGQWKWTDGSDWDFLNWVGNQPNGGQKQNSVAIEEGKWRDLGADQYSFVCRMFFK